jgi:protein SCO1
MRDTQVTNSNLRRLGLLSVALVLASLASQPARAQGGPAAEPPTSVGGPAPANAQSDELEGVGVTEHLDALLPLDTPFVDENGNEVKLGDYFHKDKPVILTLNYFVCPMLCGLMLNGMVDTLKELDYNPGAEFELVTISFNPLEKPQLAKLKKQNYVKYYGRPSANNWHFLTGTQASIDAVTQAVGFEYKWVEETQQYAHVAVLNIITPDGHISKYLYGVAFEPQTLKLALVEAGQGKIGTTADQVLLYCLHYDPATGSYAASAVKIMKFGGVVTLLLLALLLIPAWLAGRARIRRAAALAAAAPASTSPPASVDDTQGNAP